MVQPQTNGRPGRRDGQIAELTVIAPLKPGVADNLRKALREFEQSRTRAVDSVGTVHDMRWLIFDDDTRVLFATAYDGDWDAYIEDFATKIPEQMDAVFQHIDGWPGIASPTVKDFIVSVQHTTDAWYSAYPDERVTDIHRNSKAATAADDLLDALNPA
jgi:hypothetical protein